MKKYLLLLCCLLMAPVQAGVVVSGTRVIFPSSENEVTIRLQNEGKAPALVQAWLDDGRSEQSPGDIQVPFVVMPPLFRMEPGKGQALRLMYTGEPLPTVRESVYWLNVLEIPPKSAQAKTDANMIQMAFRTRIKVFFRPRHLNERDKITRAYTQVAWQLVRDGQQVLLEGHNPTPYHMSVVRLQLQANGQEIVADQGGMIAPFGKYRYQVSGLARLAGAGSVELTFGVLNDYGTEVPVKARVQMH